jgi:hypothetical protein
MLLHVPGSLAGLLSLCRPAFTQPTFQTFSPTSAVGGHTERLLGP